MNLSRRGQNVASERSATVALRTDLNTANIVENYATLTRSETLLRWWAIKRSCSITPRRRRLLTGAFLPGTA